MIECSKRRDKVAAAKVQVRVRGWCWCSCGLWRLKIAYNAQGRERKLPTRKTHDDFVMCNYVEIVEGSESRSESRINALRVLLSCHCASNAQEIGDWRNGRSCDKQTTVKIKKFQPERRDDQKASRMII